MLQSFYPNVGRAAFAYTAYEMAHAMVHPYRTFASTMNQLVHNPHSPFAAHPASSAIHAGWKVLDELTRRYDKPEFGIDSVMVNGTEEALYEEVIAKRTFCKLVRFCKDRTTSASGRDPKVLIVAPLSGHFSTLLRGTVKAMAAEHDVYITDWTDARTVPLISGRFDLNSYIDYLIEFMQLLGPNLHVLAVCQPSVPALAATAVMAQRDDPCQPLSLTLMAGPVDTDQNPTAVNQYAAEHDLNWFKNHVITYVPLPHAGAMRQVYPGFLQLAGFMGMNADSHVRAFKNYFDKLVGGDSDSIASHRRFYDEYLAVMDVTAEYFLQTVDQVFQRRLLAKGEFSHRGMLVDCSAIRNTALMTVEGENDDICGIGQTRAAHTLCSSLDDSQRFHYQQDGVGHYGVFNGTRWRTEIQPRVKQMIRSQKPR